MATDTILAAAFAQNAQARQALQALQHAGFEEEQVGVAPAGQESGNLAEDLHDLGLSHKSAKWYAQEHHAGYTIISVRPDGREEEVHDLLHQYGGVDYEHRHQATNDQEHGQTQMRAQNTASTASTQTVATASQGDELRPRSLRLREEQLHVSKERVQAGQVGLHKEIIEEQKNIDVPVTHEEVYIERRAVTDGQSDGTPIGEGEEIRVPVSAEQVNVSKDTVTTGEVAIGKRQVEETQRVSNTVRREEARLDQQGDVNVHNTTSQSNQD